MTDVRPRFTSDWLTKHQWQFERHLQHLAKQPCRIMEIGCYEGRATCWLLENILVHPDSSMVCVDIYVQPNFQENIETTGRADKVELVIGPSWTTLRGIEPASSFDFIYIDGDHSTIGVMQDAVCAFRLLKVGGVIGFDDYKWKDKSLAHEGYPKPAIDAFLKAYKARIEILTKNYQVWIRKLAE